MQLTQSSSNERVSTGNAELDRMTNGGIFRDSIFLVSGPTGGGKTLMSTVFTAAGCREGEKALILAYEESREQLLRNANSWGVDFQALEEKGLLRIICQYPESLGFEDHLLMIRREIELFKPHRLVMDSISAMDLGPCGIHPSSFDAYGAASSDGSRIRQDPLRVTRPYRSRDLPGYTRKT